MMIKGIKNIFRDALYGIVIGLVFTVSTFAEVEWKPVTFNAAMEMGQIIKGTDHNLQRSADLKFDNRLGISINNHAVINNRLDLQIGIGGLFWYKFPFSEPSTYFEITPRFGPGISKSVGTIYFGDIDQGSTTYLKLGYFPIKYNSDAVNLGEYLYRSRPYPSLVYSGGWMNVNSAAMMGIGAGFHWENLDGALTHDITFLLETDYWPFNNMSPGYVASYNSGILSLGGGMVFHHLIPVKSERLSPERAENRLINFSRLPALTNFAGDTVVHPGGNNVKMTEFEVTSLDGGGVYKGRAFVNEVDDSNVVYLTVNPDSIAYKTDAEYIASPGSYTDYTVSESYFSYRGVKIMGRFSLDFSSIIDDDFALFGEVAVLGAQNHDHFYDNRMERTPIMLGVRIPTGGILDKFVVQTEYWDSPYPNSAFGSIEYFSPVPTTDVDSEITGNDNLSWSVYVQKNLYSGLRLFLQVASDHYRPYDLISTGVLPVALPVTAKSSDWYYMFRLEIGM